MEKRVIILQHGGGELANQLWNFASIYAYCKEKGFDCQNYSFFEYSQYFNIPIDNKIIEAVFFKPFSHHHKRRNSFKTRFWRFVYKIWAKTIAYFHKEKLISSTNTTGEKYFLPPTASNPTLESLERSSNTLYFIGWLFRNPTGLLKYKEEIIEYLKPKEQYTQNIDEIIKGAKKDYSNIIGVHIRQTDYRTHKNGKYFIPQERARQILNEYLALTNRDPKKTLFIFTSDESIQEGIFQDLNILIHKGNAIEDLYLLSQCDAIIGSNSSFGNFAAYYGDKPHIIFQKERMDWDYYKNRNSYFENKYSVMSF